MVIDSSAVIAILLGESDAALFTKAIAEAPKRFMSAFSFLECCIVIEAKKGETGGRELDLFLHKSKTEIVPLRAEHVEMARTAHRKFGKGRHPAGLNIGDCCSYALAEYSGEPLLYKGGDFARTDIRGADTGRAAK